MFGFELWFVYAILSAISGGFYIFITKIGVERNYDGVILNTLGSLVSAAILIVATLFISDFESFSWTALMFIVVNSVLYMWGSVIRFEVLKCIDTAIFTRYTRTLSPLLAIFLGVLVLGETFNSYEWFGLALSLAVPLLLLSKREDERQNDLRRGLKLLLVVSVFAAIAAYALKAAVDIMGDVWLLTAIAHTLMVAVGISMALKKQSSKDLLSKSKAPRDASYIPLILLMGVFHAGSFLGFMAALEAGTLSLVYTIQSLYILIPIVLSIIFYNEHWNARKVAAIILSIVALWFLR